MNNLAKLNTSERKPWFKRAAAYLETRHSREARKQQQHFCPAHNIAATHTKKARGFAAGVVAGLLFALSVGTALGATPLNEVLVNFYNDITLYVDGNQIIPKDVTGKVVYPIIYEGTTYLPVRAVGEALGQKVEWEGTTRSVYIGERPGQKTYLMDVLKPYAEAGFGIPSAIEWLSMAGEKYYHGFSFDYLSSTGYFPEDGFLGNHYAVFNLNGKYSTLEFDAGVMDKGGYGKYAGEYMENCVLSVLGDDRLLQTFNIGGHDMPQHCVIDISGVLKLEFRAYQDTRGGSGTYLGLGEVTIN